MIDRERFLDVVAHLLALQMHLEILEEMNGVEEFWRHLGELPNSRNSVHQMRHAQTALRVYRLGHRDEEF